MLQGINLEVAAEWNRRVVLQILQTTGQKTRREIAAIAGLSMPTIANISRLLIKDGFVRESGRTRGGRGQPAIRLQIVKDRAIARDHKPGTGDQPEDGGELAEAGDG